MKFIKVYTKWGAKKLYKLIRIDIITSITKIDNLSLSLNDDENGFNYYKDFENNQELDLFFEKTFKNSERL